MADNIVRLKVDSTEYDSKIKRAAAGIQHMADACHRAGGVLNVLEKENKEYIQSLGHMETVSRSARGRLAELTSAFTDIKSVYHNLTAEEKASPFGRELAKQLDIMKGRIGDTRLELASINKELGGSKFGQLGGIIDNIGQRFGVTGNLTEMLTSKTALLTGAIGALSAAVVKGGEAWLQYNQQMARQDEITTVTTGLKGDDANNMTDSMRALSQTYGVDFRQAVEAANTLMSQFGTTGEEAISILKDGMQGMTRGDGAKLLSMIQQYAPAFQSAGVSASQLVAVIQNSEGGIFTDQNMSAIVMGIRNIRLMTNNTAAALAKLGIDGEKVTKAMEDGSMNVFDALKLVSGKLKDVDSNSKAAGEVMQAVFGRQGAMAGTNLGKAIDSLNTNLAETKRQTGEVGEAMADLQTANENLNKAIREAFGYDGWDQMTIGIKTKLIGALSDTVEALAKVRDIAVKTYDVLDLQLGVSNWIEAGTWVVGKMAEQFNGAYLIAKKLYDLINSQADKQAGMDALGASGPTVADILSKGKTKTPDPDVSVDPNKPIPGKGNGSQKTYRAESISSKYRPGVGIEVTESMASLQKQLSTMQRVQLEATTSFDYNDAQQKIDELKSKIEAQQLAINLGISVEDAQSIQSSLTDSINEMVEDIKDQITPISINVKATGAVTTDKQVDELYKDTQKAAGAMNTLGSALASLEDPSAKVAGIVMQSIANVALAFSEAMKTPKDPWSWIAFAAAGTAAMVSTIAAIHDATGYAEGGIVEGNSYSGDNTLIRANAGELILNKASQSNLANALEAPAQVGLGNVRPYMRNDDIYLGLRDYGRKHGLGDPVFART